MGLNWEVSTIRDQVRSYCQFLCMASSGGDLIFPDAINKSKVHLVQKFTGVEADRALDNGSEQPVPDVGVSVFRTGRK